MSLFKAFAGFLAVSLAKNLPPEEESDEIWSWLFPMQDDQHPTSQEESDYPSDPYSHAINTVRGDANTAAVEYSLWRFRNREGDENVGKAEMERLLQLLIFEGLSWSRVSRAVLGVHLPQVCFLAPDWVLSNTDALFPNDDQSQFRSIFVTYVRWGRFYVDTFEILKDQYTRAIGDETIWKGQEGYDSWLYTGAEQIVEHTILAIETGVVRLDEPGRPAAALFDLRSEQAIKYALPFIGRRLREAGESLSQEAILRYQVFFDSLIDQVAIASEIKDLEYFGWIYGCPQFDGEWLHAKTLRVLKLSGSLSPQHVVLNGISRHKEQYLEESFTVFESLFPVESDFRWVAAHEKEIVEIMTFFASHEKLKLRQALIVQKLAEQGVLSFIDFD